jgi:hypothetical protein
MMLAPRATEAAGGFANGVYFGTVTAFELTEVSGLVASRQNPGVLWTHNDSGYPGSVFAISTNGALLARYWAQNVYSGNFEDIAIGPARSPERQYIYLGDIGDNFSSRFNIRVIRFPEPAVYAYQESNPWIDVTAESEEIYLTYPDGPHDAEALMVDPLTGDLFIVTKQDPNARLYRATRAQLDSGGPLQLTFIREIVFSGFRSVSAGDISFDGLTIAMRRNGRAWVWNRSVSQTVEQALSFSGTEAEVVDEPNGEALAFHPTGLGYFTMSETDPEQMIYSTTNYYFRRTSSVSRQPAVFIKPGDVWRYQDRGVDEGTAWRQPAFVDSEWSMGAGQFGYGQGDEQTVVSYGIDDFEKNTTSYFRKQFSRPATFPYTNLALRVCFNDGIAVYLNGSEVLRRNLEPEAPYQRAANGPNTVWQNYWLSVPIDSKLVTAGLNTIAVEVHRFLPYDSTLSFDLQFGEGVVESPAHFTGAPELSGGVLRIGIAGPAGSLARVEATTDLQFWTGAGQVVLTNGTGQFQETVSPPTSRRFYRLKK